MGNDTVKTTREWARELGFENLSIQIKSSAHIRMQPIDASEYYRTHRFVLQGAVPGRCDDSSSPDFDDPGWEALGHLDMVEFREADAQAAGVSVRVPVPGWAQGLKEIRDTAGVCNVLILERFWIESKFQGLGLIKHLFERALTFYNHSSYVLAQDHPINFHEDVRGSYGRFRRGGGRVFEPLGFNTFSSGGHQGLYLRPPSPRGRCNAITATPSAHTLQVGE